MKEVVTHNAQETVEFGRGLARELQAGDLIALTGELGAGKTCLVKGIALGLETGQEVTSPTFTLIHEYRGGRLPLVFVPGEPGSYVATLAAPRAGRTPSH